MSDARVVDDWRVRLNYHYNDPFDYFDLTFSPLSRLETNFRITKIKMVSGFSDSNAYGSYKDKSIDLKFLIAKEDGKFPAEVIAL